MKFRCATVPLYVPLMSSLYFKPNLLILTPQIFLNNLELTPFSLINIAEYFIWILGKARHMSWGKKLLWLLQHFILLVTTLEIIDTFGRTIWSCFPRERLWPQICKNVVCQITLSGLIKQDLFWTCLNNWIKMVRKLKESFKTISV